MNLSKLKIFTFFLAFFLILVLVFCQSPNLFKSEALPPDLPKAEFLESQYINLKDYNESFDKCKSVTKTPILATITSHHFLAKDLIAETFSGIDSKGIKTVIVISPDHFKEIDIPGIFVKTTDSSWQTIFGNMNSGKHIINKILQEEGTISDIDPFRLEHGIFTIIPFAKKTIPQADVVPLILKQSNNYQYFYNLGNEISKIVNLEETLLVVSSDFTHYSTKQVANINDKKSIDSLPNKKIEEIDNITNDCRQCIAFLFGYLKDTDTNFELVFNKNSYDISGEDPDNVTSYVGANYSIK